MPRFFRGRKFLKTCSKCFTHHDQRAWKSLPLLGDEEGDEGWHIEVRACECGATLSLALRFAPTDRERAFYGAEAYA